MMIDGSSRPLYFYQKDIIASMFWHDFLDEDLQTIGALG